MSLLFQFPGQTSFAPDMVQRAMALWPDASAATLAEASDALRRDLSSWADEVTPTGNRDLQLAVFVTNQIHLEGLRAEGIDTSISLGHSLGEYSHLVHIGMLPFAGACRLVHARGAAYDDGPDGAMVALFPLEAEALEPLLEAHPEVWLAVENSPTQHVVAGAADAVRRFVEAVEEQTYASAVEIGTGLPMHSPRFAPVATDFHPCLAAADWQRPWSPWVPNLTGQPEEAPSTERLADVLSRHVCEPVQWRRSIETLCALHAPAAIVEVGHGHGLTRLLRRPWRSEPRVSSSDPESLREVLDGLR